MNEWTMRRIAAAICLVAFGSLYASALLAQSAGAPVKLSNGGICHEPSSPHYARLKDFHAFATMDACISAGGRLSQAAARKAESQAQATWAITGLAALAAFAVVALLLYKWYARRRKTIVEAEFRDAERRRWEGHRLEKPPDKT